MALKICSHPLCNRLQREARCEEHRYKQKSKTKEERDPFYHTNAWRKLSQSHLVDEPLCRMCQQAGRLTPASQVDHILPRSTHPDLEWDSDNLQSSCASCHSRKTATEDGGFGRKRKQA